MLSLPAGNEMFHFPAFPPLALCVQARVIGHDSCRVSPFGNPRIKARLAAPRGLSQPPTSFIGSWCQGIHRAPLLAWPQRCSRPLCSSQGAGGPVRGPVACHRKRWGTTRERSSRGKAPDRPSHDNCDRPALLRAEQTKTAARRRQARSLRTQQRARPDAPSPASFLPEPNEGPVPEGTRLY